MKIKMKKTVGVIGFGNMGSAIAGRIKSRYRVIVFDQDRRKTASLRGIKAAQGIKGLLNDSGVIILAVKPQDFGSVLNLIRGRVKDKLIISIAAGITTAYIEKILRRARIVRVMPNIGAKTGNSVTCICKGRFALDKDLLFVRDLFKKIGKVQGLKEDKMNAATAISGSGPGYYFAAVESGIKDYKNSPGRFKNNFIVSLTQAAQRIGFDKRTARFLSRWTVVYSDLLWKKTRLAPAELRRQVTSKKGTTEAALAVLHKGGTLVEAVKAALKRAKQLSRR